MLLDQESTLLRQLIELLNREQAMLVESRVDTISPLLTEKSQLLQSLNLATRSRYQKLAEAGLQPDESGMAAWIRQQGDAIMTRAWSNLRSALNQAKEINRVNGLLITRQYNRNQQLLNAMQGHSDQHQIYGANGQATNAASYTRGAVQV